MTIETFTKTLFGKVTKKCYFNVNITYASDVFAPIDWGMYNAIIPYYDTAADKKIARNLLSPAFVLNRNYVDDFELGFFS